MNKNALIKQHFEQLYENYYLEQYRAYLQDEDNEKVLLEDYVLSVRNNPEWLDSVPKSVRSAYDYYKETISQRDLGAVRVYQLPYENNAIYAIRVSTDGDDGWLELYDYNGQEVGVGRTYLELIGWGNVDEIRDQVHEFGFPVSLHNKEKKTFWQFGSYAIARNSPDCFLVIAEEISEEIQDDAIQIICNATDVSEKPLRLIFDFLPHAITENISQEKAEDIWQRLTEIGVKASIKEF